jgi:hypothetical protein
MFSRNTILAALIAVIAVGLVYMLDPTLFGLLARREGFENVINSTGAASMTGAPPQPGAMSGGNYVNGVNANKHLSGGQHNETTAPANNEHGEATEGFENLSPETMPFPSAKQPANCYPKNQLAPQELLPNDPNSKWAQVNPQASGDIAGKNFLSAGALIGVNTIGQSNRNANWDIRAAPANPQVEVSPWLQSTIGPDLERRPLDIA